MLPKAPVLEFSSTDEIYLILDRTYFPNDIHLVVYRNFYLRSAQLFLFKTKPLYGLNVHRFGLIDRNCMLKNK